MNKFQFTTQDYLAYLKMSNHEHILVEDADRKRMTEELLTGSHSMFADVNVDDVEYLVYFERPHSNEEKVALIFSNAIRFPFARRIVRVMMGYTGPRRAVLVPINDTHSITERVDEVLTSIVSKNIEAYQLSDVRDYLLQHIDLIDLLPFVARVAFEGFSPDTQLSLELYRDPEVEDTYLAIFGRNQQYDEEFSEAIKLIRAEYTDSLTAKSGWILVTTDFGIPHTSR